jgi:serine/threonine-protein kinase
MVLLVGAFGATLLANARAEAARSDAERRFEQTRAIARSLLFDVFDEVSRVPASTRAREKLARTGLVYLDALAGDPSAPTDVRIEAGLGYLRLAQVVGGGQASQLGRYEDADALLKRSEEILGAVERADPGNPDVRLAMASLLVEQAGTDLYNENDPETARRQARRAQALLRERAQAPEAAPVFADAMRAEGDSYLWTEDYARALDLHLSAERFIAGLPEKARNDPRLMTIRAGNLRLLAEAHHKLGHVAEARAVLDQAVDINRATLASQPNDPLLRRRLITSLRYRAIVHRTNHRDALARQSIEEARSQAIKWRDRDPDDVGALQISALVSEVQAQILADLGRYRESFAAGDEALAAHRRMVRLAGDAPGALRSMAQAMRTDGGNHYNGGDYAGACRIWSDTLAIFAQLDRRGALTDFDRKNSAAETRAYLHRACDPPRPALGRSI